MVRVAAIVVCLTLCFVSSLVECAPQKISSNVNVSVVENLSKYLSENPQVKLLQPLVREVSAPKLQIIYRLGNRIAGDRLVATASGNQSWGSAQDVKLTLSYPKSGIGAVITFLQIPVEQSTNLGQGYVTSGGIGQRQITIVIEAKSTLYFKYSAEIYGY